ncbi:MAG: aldo/keto reductase [Candidatus Omnitrophota bacterium]|nr:aldo/keto reductase [Candidatus Omnitrophota bacterium]
MGLMKYRQLGRTQLKISEVGFGCWAIGGSSYGPTKDEESLEALEVARDHGINFLDTADTYGHGHSEELIARFLKGKPRESIIIASKVGWDFYHGGARKNFDPGYIRFACEESLKRLGIETLDLYQLHNPKVEEIEREEAVGVLEQLKREGKIRFIGISIGRQDEAYAALEDPRVDAIQLIFNMIDQRMADGVFELAAGRKVGIIAREPLACGILTGKYGAEHEFAKDDHRRRWNKEKMALDIEKLKKIQQIVSSDRMSIVRAALEYVLHFPEVSTVIPGAKTKEQVLENLKATLDPKLRIQEASHLRDLYDRDEIFSKGLIPS